MGLLKTLFKLPHGNDWPDWIFKWCLVLLLPLMLFFGAGDYFVPGAGFHKLGHALMMAIVLGPMYAGIVAPMVLCSVLALADKRQKRVKGKLS